MSDLLAALVAMSPVGLALAGGLVALAESALGLGLFLPGEVGIVGLTALAGTGWLRAVLFVAVAAGALAGDHVGFLVGRRVGPGMADWRIVVRLGPGRWAGAMAAIRRRGTVALFVSRLLPVVRTIMPAAAGAAGLSYSRFLVASATGAFVWAGLWVGAGSMAGELVRAINPLS